MDPPTPQKRMMSRKPNDKDAIFDRWSGHWSDHYAERGLMVARIGRFSTALDKRVTAGAAILDFGCGTGEITRALAAAGWRMTGCDSSPAMIERARRADDGTVCWRQLDSPAGSGLPFADESFDGAISSSVFEYLDDPSATAGEIARVLKPDGVFLLTVPDPRHAIRRIEARKIPFARSAIVWGLIRHTRWADQFAYLRMSANRWPPETWAALLDQAGFAVEDLPACTDPLIMLAARKRPVPGP